MSHSTVSPESPVSSNSIQTFSLFDDCTTTDSTCTTIVKPDYNYSDVMGDNLPENTPVQPVATIDKEALMCATVRELLILTTKGLPADDLIDSMQKIFDTGVKACKVSTTKTLHFHTALNRPPYVPPCILLNGVRIGSIGNFVTVVAPAGAGKSAMLECIQAAALLREKEHDKDVFQFSINTQKSILYCDTEMSREDSYHRFELLYERAGLTIPTDSNTCVHYAWLTDLTATESLQAIINEIESEKYSVVIVDGIADLMTKGVNNEEETVQLLQTFSQSIRRHNVCLICVIHLNPQSNGGLSDKARGHLGSELIRKSETVLKIDVDRESDVRTISNDFKNGKRRSAGIVSHSFVWSNEKSMFVSCNAPEKSSYKPKKELEYTEMTCELAKIKSEFTFTELVQIISEKFNKNKRAAKHAVDYLSEHKYIFKQNDLWHIVKDTSVHVNLDEIL